jgi:hypothetical protein
MDNRVGERRFPCRSGAGPHPERVSLRSGCESVAAIQLVRNGSKAGFSIKVTLPGEAELITIERATACVECEMRWRYRRAD